MKAAVQGWVEQNQSYIQDKLRYYVRIPSENLYPTGNEAQVQLAWGEWLKELGFATISFIPTEVDGLQAHEAFLDDGRDYTGRPNVVGTLKGKGLGRSLLFSGHMDTVPRGLEPWAYDSFGGRVVDGKQFGLGIFDMKGGMVAAALAAQCLQELQCHLNGDLIIEAVVDEEFGGANGTLACRLLGITADAAIIPEPTNLAICPVNQGGAYYRISFRGVAGRSYSGEGLANPIDAAARFIEIIRSYHTWRNNQRVPHAMFTNQELPTLIQCLHAGDPSIALSDRVPRECYLDLWIQVLPGVTELQIRKEFVDFYEPLVANDPILSHMPPVLQQKMRFLPGTSMDDQHPIIGALKLAGHKVQGEPLAFQGAPFACDSFMFNLYSTTPAVIFGPSGGNAHAANEYIVLEDYYQLIQMYALTILDWCGGHNE